MTHPLARLNLRSTATFATLAVCGMGALAGCGGGSSKPGYCSDVSDFKSAVSGLTGVSSASELSSAVQKVETSGQKLVTDAKSAFPTEIDALNASLASLKTTAKQLTDPQTQKQALTSVPAQALAVKASFNSLQSAVKSKCD